MTQREPFKPNERQLRAILYFAEQLRLLRLCKPEDRPHFASALSSSYADTKAVGVPRRYLITAFVKHAAEKEREYIKQESPHEEHIKRYGLNYWLNFSRRRAQAVIAGNESTVPMTRRMRAQRVIDRQSKHRRLFP